MGRPTGTNIGPQHTHTGRQRFCLLSFFFFLIPRPLYQPVHPRPSQILMHIFLWLLLMDSIVNVHNMNLLYPVSSTSLNFLKFLTCYKNTHFKFRITWIAHHTARRHVLAFIRVGKAWFPFRLVLKLEFRVKSHLIPYFQAFYFFRIT